MHTLIFRVIGHVHEPWQTEAIHSYVNKLKPFAKVDMIELDEKHGGAVHPNEQKTRELESQSLLKGIPKDAIVIALDSTGKNLTSTDLASNLKDWSAFNQPLVFLIGGSWGFDDTVRQAAHHIISFGKQTLPHLLARVLLLEQLYRAETILHGKTYHK